ncbi:MAG: low molecular weight protein-tyrosine-phosphatase [Chloroflexota bacterium]
MTRLLFVCLGNIIRSPLAEHLFLHLANQAGVADRYEVDSAGTAGWHAGEGPDPRMRKTAKDQGVDLGGTARQIRMEDLDSSDLILAMDASNRRDLLTLARSPAQRGKVRLLREFDPLGGEGDVPDPYYGEQDGFEQTYRIVERSVQGLLEALERGEV